MKAINKFFGEYRFLSNFYPCPLIYQDYPYTSVEHAFQTAKTSDPLEKTKIANASTPGIAKRLGRKVKLRSDWEKVKDQIMYEILLIKFSDQELRERLMNTGTADLIEGNTWGDTYWGVCNGVGSNKLGKLLMKVRDNESQGNNRFQRTC